MCPILQKKSKKSGAPALSSELEEPPLLNEAQPGVQLSWKERAKTFAIEYGRVGVCTHIVLSLVSFSAIYVGVSAGVDVSSLLNTVGLSVSTSESTANSAGSAVIAYAIYKLLSPVRWPLTFAVTPVVMRALRKRGYMLPTTTSASASLPARRSPPPPTGSV